MPQYQIEFDGQRLTFETVPTLFSPNRADRGTLAMLSVVQCKAGEKLLDLGCGCGLVGTALAGRCGAENIWMTDISPEAVATASENAVRNGIYGAHVLVSDGFRSLDETGFDLILSNPPYQTDFAVAKHFIEKGFNRLKIGGRLYMVTKRLDWYRNRLRSIFGGVRVREIDGYYVFEAERRTRFYANYKA